MSDRSATIDPQEKKPVSPELFINLLTRHRDPHAFLSQIESHKTTQGLADYLSRQFGEQIDEEKAEEIKESFEEAKKQNMLPEIESPLNEGEQTETEAEKEAANKEREHEAQVREAENKRREEENEKEKEELLHHAHLEEHKKASQEAPTSPSANSPTPPPPAATAASKPLPQTPPSPSATPSPSPLKPMSNGLPKQNLSIGGLQVNTSGQIVGRSGGAFSTPPPLPNKPPDKPKRFRRIRNIGNRIKTRTATIQHGINNFRKKHRYVASLALGPIGLIGQLGADGTRLLVNKIFRRKKTNIPATSVAQQNLETVYKKLGVDKNGQAPKKPSFFGRIKNRFSRFSERIKKRFGKVSGWIGGKIRAGERAIQSFAKKHPYLASWAGGPLGFAGYAAYRGASALWKRTKMGERLSAFGKRLGKRVSKFADRISFNPARKAIQAFVGQLVKKALVAAATAAFGAVSGGMSLAIQGAAMLANKLTGGLLNKAFDKTPLGILLSKRTTEEKVKDIAKFPFVAFGIVLGILAFFFIFPLLFIIGPIGGGGAGQNPKSVAGLTIQLDAQAQVNNGSQINYTVTVTCNTSCQNAGSIIIYEPNFPQGTSFGSADGTYATTPYPITWGLNNNTPTSSGGINTYIFHFTLNTTANDTYVSNIVYGDVGNSTGTGTNPNPIPGLILKKTSVPHVNNGDNITYTITTAYTGTSAITLNDPFPAGTSFVSATGIFTKTTTSITWDLQKNVADPSCKSNSANCTFSLVLKPSNDTVVINKIFATTPSMGTTGFGTNIVWLPQFDKNQYLQYFDTVKNQNIDQWANYPNDGGASWFHAKCSGASMAEVFNAYQPSGTKYKIGDILKYEYDANLWDLQNGTLYGQDSILKTADHFGFNGVYKQYSIDNTSLDQVISIAQDQHHPVIVGAPFHWLVVYGGDKDYVYLLDSSPHNFTYLPSQGQANDYSGLPNILNPKLDYKMPRNNFLTGQLGGDLQASYWNGQAIVLTPK